MKCGWMIIVTFAVGLTGLGCTSDPKPESVSPDNGGDTDSVSTDSADSSGRLNDTAPGSKDTATHPKPFVDNVNVDDDSDGYTNNEGDCNDVEPFIGPEAVEDLGPDGQGDGIDNDCDGETDEVEACDDAIAGLRTLGKEPDGLARAMELCDPRFFLGAQKHHSNEINYDVAYNTPSLGVMGPGQEGDCFVPRAGKHFSVIATGPLQGNANDQSSIDPMVKPADDPQPDFQADEPSAPSDGALICDLTQFSVELKAPMNAYGFSFDFLFASAEYQEWLGQGWNDTFYAILETSELNGGATTNIAFDSNHNEIEVDANFFENDIFQCSERGTPWDPNNIADGDVTGATAGSTGWLRTVWNITPGATFKLTFSIHDEGNPDAGSASCGWDSMVALDNFRWLTEEVEVKPGTTIIID